LHSSSKLFNRVFENREIEREKEKERETGVDMRRENQVDR